MLRWPDDRAEVERAAAAGLPRLLLLGPETEPPEGGDCAEDWVRLPAEDRDVGARIRALSRRATHHQARPEVDGQGRLLHHGAWVALSPLEVGFARLLVERYGSVVAPEELSRAGWGDEIPTANALRVQLHRLRQRIAPLGLEIRSIRNFGVILQDRAKARGDDAD